ncbi:ParA family partition ATPase [Sphingobium aromaticiconvertens]|uniref:ParA family partition ATPase n=1 Tax=Sphingobium aromaticiconvertens TaxID=365341 RepID=UPI0030161A6A
MILALVNQKGGAGKTTLALHLAGQWARQGMRICLIDADPQGSALDWAEQRAAEGHQRLFGVIGLSRETLHIEAREQAASVDHVIIDGPPRVAALMRSALIAADLALIPVQPSALDGWASAEIVSLVAEARGFHPSLDARFVLNRCDPRTLIARRARAALADRQPAPLTTGIAQRVLFAQVMAQGSLASEADPGGPAACDIARLAAEIMAITR